MHSTDYIIKQEELFEAGFACEVVLDGLPEFPCWRGCFSYYNKKGAHIQDDCGAYGKEGGGIRAAYDRLLGTYEALRHDIDPDGLRVLASTRQLSGLPLLSAAQIDHVFYTNTIECRKICAAQQYAVKESETHGIGAITRIKTAWEAGFETHEEYTQSDGEKQFTLDDMVRCLSWVRMWDGHRDVPRESYLAVKKWAASAHKEKTEWDCRVETERVCGDENCVIPNACYHQGKPTLCGLKEVARIKLTENGFITIKTITP